MSNAKCTLSLYRGLFSFLLSMLMAHGLQAQHFDCGFGSWGKKEHGNSSGLVGITQGNDKIFVGFRAGGNFRYYEFNDSDGSFVRTSASVNPSGEGHSAQHIAYSNGGVVISGTSNYPDNAGGKRKATIVKYNADGSKAWERNHQYGIIHTDHAHMTTDPNGKILICGEVIGRGGNHSDKLSLVARLNHNGHGERTYKPNYFVNNNGYPGPEEGFDRVGSNGKYVYAAGSIADGNYRKIRVVKLNDTTFHRDLSFGTNGIFDFKLANNKYFYVEDLVVQSDNKVLLLISYDNNIILVRLNVDGGLDTSFSGDGKVNVKNLPKRLLNYYTLDIQQDDKVVMGGYHNFPNEIASIRLNTDGSQDLNYAGNGLNPVVPTGNAAVKGAVVSPDGFHFVISERLYLPSRAPNHKLLSIVKFDLNQGALNCNPPVARCQSVTVSYNQSDITITSSDIDNGSFMPNSPGTITISPSTFDCSHVGDQVVNMNLLDPNGRAANCNATVTIQDNIGPSINCPSNMTVNTDPGQNCATVSYAMPMMTDNCGNFSAALISGPASGTCVPVYQNGGVHTVTLGGSDANNNSASCTFTITVVDNEAPIARCNDLTVNITANGYATPYVNFMSSGSQDNSQAVGFPGIVSRTLDKTSFNCGQIGNHVVSLTVTDPFNNSSSCTANVLIQDPNGACAALEYVEARCKNTQVDLDANGQASINTADINNGSVTSTGLKSVTVSPKDFTCSHIGIQQVTLTVTDTYDNISNCTADVTVSNPQLPAAICQGVVVQLDASGNGSTTALAIDNGSNHNCNTDLSLSKSDFNCSDIGVSTVSLSATDSQGKVGTCTATVTVEDKIKPVISCQSTSLSLDANGLATLEIGDVDNGSYDVCSNINTVLSKTSFDCSNLGSNSVVMTITDASQNSNTCTVTVLVEDQVYPQISCPANVSLSNDPGKCSRMLTYITPIGTDNCSPNTVITSGLGSGSDFPLGTTTESYTVTDASGKTASCSFSITISDDEKPVLTLNGDNPLYLCEGDSYVEPGATASDNCDANVNQNIATDNSTVNSNQEGSYTVYYNLTDVNGNTATQMTRTVIVKHTPAQLAPQNCSSCSQIRFDFCEGDATPNLEALLSTNANHEQGVSFLWYADNSGSQGSAINAPIPNMTNKNTRFYWVSQSINGCEGQARRVRVRVRKTSTVVLDVPALGCNTGQLNLASYVSDSRGIATGFTFYDSDPEQGNPTALGTATATKGQVNAGEQVIVGLPAQQITYYARAINNTGCQVTGSDEVSSAAGASLNPIANHTVQAGDLVHVSFNSPNATHIFWFDHSSFNNPTVGLPGVFGMGDLIFTAANSSGVALNATIRAIAYNGNCAGEVQDFTITVLPGAQNRSGANRTQLAASRVNAHDVEINWQIDYEFVLSHIEIEKQINNGEWASVGTDHNLSLPDGTYLDRSGMGNVTKYRLKLVHTDGRVIWTKEVEVSFEYFDNKRFTIYPNPSNGRFMLRAAGPIEGEWHYKLSDGMGRTLLSGNLEEGETAFDISHLPAAYYFLVMTSPEGKSYLRKIAKR